MIKSPLNYVGGKAKILNQIMPLFPKKINNFVDLFCGGCNVGINVQADHIYFNDNNKKLILLYQYFYKTEIDFLVNNIYKIIKKYNLSLVRQYGYEYYHCNSSQGVGEYNKDKYNRLRKRYNTVKNDDLNNIILYILIVYAFNNQIRFNSKGEFNLPVGKRDFNKNMEEKLITFVNTIKTKKCTFTNKDFRKIKINKLNENDFVYADPPYLITCASYNENMGWTANDEENLLQFLDNLNKQKVKFALSNVLENKGKKNEILNDWLKRNKKYNVIHLSNSYKNCNYHTNKKNDICDEVLIINY